MQTKLVRSPQGSYASYQLSLNENNFKLYCDITAVSRLEPGNPDVSMDSFPRLPVGVGSDNFQIPTDITMTKNTLFYFRRQHGRVVD